ncbi:MAG: glycyl-radical enzyme activating protein [Armatimonadota bacterium]|nr:MAG: glycyl-radical enzyme activating protein [Armatimonadota bacterium]
MTTGLIFDIQRFCLHDGPGIRTTVFFKGCSLRCRWCHNPESIARQPEMYFWPERCLKCGACAQACPRGAIRLDGARRVLRRLCDACGECARVCPGTALEVIGRAMTADEVLAVVLRDEPFYRTSGGGVTLSGGEPLAQPDFALELMAACRAHGLHVTLDTAGNVRDDVFGAAAAAADLILLDVKHPDPEAHRRFTGVSNERALRNLAFLARSGRRFIVRVPVVPGFNDSPETLLALARLAAESGAAELNLLPYHPLGESKRRRLGRTTGWPVREVMKRDSLREICEEASRLLRTTIGG